MVYGVRGGGRDRARSLGGVLTPQLGWLQVLLATDNHIGYAEKDPVRGQDSINAFREILQLAVANDVSPPE